MYPPLSHQSRAAKGPQIGNRTRIPGLTRLPKIQAEFCASRRELFGRPPGNRGPRTSTYSGEPAGFYNVLCSSWRLVAFTHGEVYYGWSDKQLLARRNFTRLRMNHLAEQKDKCHQRFGDPARKSRSTQ